MKPAGPPGPFVSRVRARVAVRPRGRWGGAAAYCPRASRPDRSGTGEGRGYTRPMAQGHVMVIGGAEDKVGKRTILSRFVALAGGADARIAVISSASSQGLVAGETYRRLFVDLGARAVFPIHATTLQHANDDESAALVDDSTGVFLTGGNSSSASAPPSAAPTWPGPSSSAITTARSSPEPAPARPPSRCTWWRSVPAVARPGSAWCRWRPAWGCCPA